MNLSFKQKDVLGIKNALIIQALNSFVWGVMYVLLPILMLERKISIESMGLIFAVLPLVFQANRMIFSVISDYAGRKKFYWLNGITNIISLLAYCLANNPITFLIGKISEAIKEASLWSVNRAYFLDHSQKAEKSLVKMRGVGYIFYAVGILGAGFIITNLFYNKTLFLLTILSLLIFHNVSKLIDKDKREISILKIIDAFKINNKSKKFKIFFWLFFIQGLYYGLISGYIFPLFLKEIGTGIEQIGLILGMQALLSGIAIYFLRSWGKGKYKLLVGGILNALSFVFIAFSPQIFLPAIIILSGISSGLSEAGGETIFVETANRESLAGDIGLLMIGVNVGISITQAVSGFIISSFGFVYLFIAAAFLGLIFSVLAFQNME
jgi:MFS family permease